MCRDEMDILAARNKTVNLDTIQIPSRPQPPSSQPMPAESSTTATATATSADTADTVVRKPVPGGKQPLVAAGSKDSLFKTKAKPTVESAPVSVAPVSTSAVTPIATKSGGISAPVANSNPFGDDDEEEDNTLQDYYKKLAADLGDTDDNVGSSDYMSQLDQLRIDDEEDQDYENDSYNPVHNGTSTLSSPSSITGKVTTAPVVVAPIVSHNDGALAEFEDDDVDIS